MTSLPSSSVSSAASLLETIDDLMTANRAQRDGELERQLVRTRHEAFAELDRSPVPPSRDDVDPAVPEVVDREELSPRVLRSGILRHGSLHVRGVVPERRVADLIEGIDRAIAGRDAFDAGTDREETTPWFEPFRPHRSYPSIMNRQLWNRRKWVREAGGVWAADSPRMLFELFDTLEEVGLREVIAGYLGERPALAVDKCTLRRVPLETSTDWHQDGAFLGTGIKTVNMWLALSHCGRDAPGLDIVPARLDRIVETGTEGAAFSWSVGPGVVERVAAATTPVRRPVFGPGDVLFFDDLFLHRTAIDASMQRERYAIESWFFAPSAYPEQYVPLVF